MRSLLLYSGLSLSLILASTKIWAQPTQLDCTAPLIETYCYDNSDTVSWTYTGTGDVMRLRFLQGTIESGMWDALKIYDGTDTNGILLFEHSYGSYSCNLGPEGSASLPMISNCFYDVDVFAPSGSIHMTLQTDVTVACSYLSWDPFIWEVTCGNAVTGKIFLDTDLDCQFDTTEYALPQMIVEVQPGPYYATTNATGDFYMVLDEGTYDIAQLSPAVIDHCNPTPQPFQVQPDGSSPLLLFPDTAATGLDLQVMMTSGPARLGFQHSQAISVQNVSANIAGQAILELTYDPILTYISAVPSPTSITGNTLVWDIAPVGPFEQLSFQITYSVPADTALLDTDLISTATVNAGVDDVDQANNSITHTRTITSAIDPNDKLASTSTGNTDVWHIGNDEWIDYTIRFQNTGTDTAFNVVITDTLFADLDPSSLQIGAGSHPFTWELKGQGILEFEFANILLPDSNVNEEASHGFVGFRIRPHLPLLPGDEISNIANIFFDFNPPVITEPSVLVAATNVGSVEMDHAALLQVHPQPSDGLVWIEKPVEGLRSVRIISIDGRVVRTIQATPGQTSFDLGQLASGRFLMEFHHGQGEVKRARLQIVH
jgi:uncharacterized repeat protein (TIGR01451 family)